MVEWTWMDSTFRQTVLRGLAYLAINSTLLIPSLVASASSLRDDAVTYRTQGYEAQRRGDDASALSFYQKAAALDPSYPTPCNDIGVLMERQGRLEDAEKSYQQALAINPNQLEAHANLAMLYERKGQKEKAIYHWLKRYQLGDAYDPWTARAEERLVGLGVLKSAPGTKGKRYASRRVTSQEFQEQEQAVEEFHSVSEEHADWP